MSDKIYFIKHIVSRPLLHGGRRVPFVEFGDDTGGIILDSVQSEGLVRGLSALNGTKGIKRVTREEFEETKKNSIAAQSQRTSRHPPSIRIQTPQLLPPKPAAVGQVESEPLSIPKEIPPPRKKPGPKPKPLPTQSLAPIPAAAQASA